MKSSKTAPNWAVNLVTQVCKDYKRALPKKFQWYNVNRDSSSGYTYYNGSTVHISAGLDKDQQKSVVLHELAHHLVAKTKAGRRAGHNLKFWRLVYELGGKYDYPHKKTYHYNYEVYAIKRYLRGSFFEKAKQAYEELPK